MVRFVMHGSLLRVGGWGGGRAWEAAEGQLAVTVRAAHRSSCAQQAKPPQETLWRAADSGDGFESH